MVICHGAVKPSLREKAQQFLGNVDTSKKDPGECGDPTVANLFADKKVTVLPRL